MGSTCWIATSRGLREEDPFLQTADDMSFFIHGDGAFLKLDQDGRITVNDFIREHTGISAEVAFVGRGQFFQIWEPGRLKAYGAEARARLMRIRQAALAAACGRNGMTAGHGEDIQRRWRTGPPHSGSAR